MEGIVMTDTETPRPMSDALLFEAIAKIITNAAPDNGHWTEWEPEVTQIISLVRSQPQAQSEVDYVAAIAASRGVTRECERLMVTTVQTVEALRPYITQRPVDLEWQPIETAPKTQQYILLFGTVKMRRAAYHTPKVLMGVWGGEGLGWTECMYQYDPAQIIATHWMPLPNPPDAKTPYTEKGGR